MMKTLKKIHDWNEVPEFETDAEASRFWDEHALAPELLAEGTRQAPAGLAAILARKPKTKRLAKRTQIDLTDALLSQMDRAIAPRQFGNSEPQKPETPGYREGTFRPHTRAKTIHFDVDMLDEAAKRAKLEGVTQEEFIKRALDKALKSA
jgi:hypothetical protein